MGCMMLSMRLEIVCTRARVSAFAAHLMVILWCELALQANSKTIIYLFICFIAFVCICYSIYDLYVCDFPFKFLDAPNWWKKPSKLLRSKTIDELKQVNVFSLEWPAHPVIILNSECSYSAFNRPPPLSLCFSTHSMLYVAHRTCASAECPLYVHILGPVRYMVAVFCALLTRAVQWGKSIFIHL